SRASMILSASSRAPRRPTSGLAPAPRPLVSLVPSWIFTGARDICSACKSVLATTNSTPSTPAQIMRFTALPPPPPTPITLIFALLRGSSLKLMRMSSVFSSALPFAIKSSPFETDCLCKRYPHLHPPAAAGGTARSLRLRQTTSSALPLESPALLWFGLRVSTTCTSISQRSSRSRFAPDSSASVECRSHFPIVRSTAEPAPRFRRFRANGRHRRSERSRLRVLQRLGPGEVGREASQTTLV